MINQAEFGTLSQPPPYTHTHTLCRHSPLGEQERQKELFGLDKICKSRGGKKKEKKKDVSGTKTSSTNYNFPITRK